MRRLLQPALKLGITALLFVWLASTTDLRHVGRVLADVSPLALAGSAGLFVLQALVLGWRWHRIVAWLGTPLPATLATRWVFIGLFFNQALPSSIGGDAVRVWLLNRHGAGAGVPFASVAIERGTGVAMLGLLTSACTLALPPAGVPAAVRLPLLLVGPALAGLLLVLAFADRWWPGRAAGLLRTQVATLGQGLRAMARRPDRLLEVLLLGLLSGLLGVLASWVIGQDLGVEVGLLPCIALVGGTVLLAVVPVSLGGWGLRETTMVALFGLLGAPAAPVLAMALLTGLLPLLVALPASLLWRSERGDGGVRKYEVHG